MSALISCQLVRSHAAAYLCSLRASIIRCDVFKHADCFPAQYTKLKVIKSAQTEVAAQLGRFGRVGGVAAGPSVVAGRSVALPPLVEANDDMLQSLALSHYAANVVEVCSLGSSFGVVANIPCCFYLCFPPATSCPKCPTISCPFLPTTSCHYLQLAFPKSQPTTL